MPTEKSQHWAEFFNKELALLDYVNTTCQIIDVVTGCEPTYKRFSDLKGMITTKAPAYIRCVAVLPDNCETSYSLCKLI
jgi:hypothetical protein